MGKFGEKLRRERELRGVTLEEIADATKIGTRSLKALEDERFDLLPGGIFNKGFVRSYAKFLGLDEEQAVADYVTAFNEQPAQTDVLEKMAAQAEAVRKNEAVTHGQEPGNLNKLWIALAVILLLAAGSYASWQYYQRRAAAKLKAMQPPPAVQTTPSAPVDTAQQVGTPTSTTTTEAPKTDALTTSPQSAAPAPKSGIELQIHVSRATWIELEVDGRSPVQETLRDSATKTVVADNQVVLTTGNAVELTCNGNQLGIQGEDNKRSQFHISSNCKLN